MELYLFGTEEAARIAGFDTATMRHPQYATLRAWVPSMGKDAFRGLRPNRVTVTENLGRVIFNKPNAETEKAFREARAVATHLGAQWIDLR